MSKSDKALQKILQVGSEKNVTFDELTAVLGRKGFVPDGGKGSHQVWRHDDGRKIVLPRHGKDIKPIYVKTARQLLERNQPQEEKQP